jgi:hypothetical protein
LIVLCLPLPALAQVPFSMYLDRAKYDSLDLTGQGFIEADSSPPAGTDLHLDIVLGATPVWQSQTALSSTDRYQGFLMDVTGLGPGDYELRARLMLGAQELGSATNLFSMVDLSFGASVPSPSGTVPIRVQPNAAAAGDQALTCGVPMPRGVMLDADHVRLIDGLSEVPLQAQVTARWSPNGYVKWLLLDFPGTVDSSTVKDYALEYGPSVQRTVVSNPVTVTSTGGVVSVDTGPLQFTVKQSGFSFLESATYGGENLISGSRICLVDESNNLYEASCDLASEVTVEQSGPVRAVVRAEGWFVDDQADNVGRYVVRIYAYRGQAYLRVFHTFIITEPTKHLRYKNITIESTLTQLGTVLFGMENAAHVTATNTSAYLVQAEDEVGSFVDGGAQTSLVGGPRGAGWIDTGKLLVAVKDFRQQYPKELEINGTNVSVHFWPRHPGSPTHPVGVIDESNIHQLWFAHEGELLDFSIPASYNVFTNGEFYYIENVLADGSDEALGIAKTHEMLWQFHAPPVDPAVAVAFQQEVGCLPNPAWINETRAAGYLHPAGDTNFPAVEAAISGHFDWRARTAETNTAYRADDYGMWNWGDIHSNWTWFNPFQRRWLVNRTWANHHHGNPRVKWLLYMRSGDPRYLASAKRNNRHLMDIDMCHYSTPAYTALAYPNQKVPGALCDYKGLVHWHSGGRLYDYNMLSDYLFYDYYLTGYRRAVDVAAETAQTIWEDYYTTGASTGRDGAGRLAALTFMYEATWDWRLLRQIQKQAERMLTEQITVPPYAGWFPNWAGYAPWLQRTIGLTRDPTYVDALERWWDILQPKRMLAFYAKVDPVATTAAFDTAIGYDGGGASVWEADGTLIAHAQAHTLDWVTLQFPVTPHLANQLLRLTHGRDHAETTSFITSGWLPWISISPERFFVPGSYSGKPGTQIILH